MSLRASTIGLDRLARLGAYAAAAVAVAGAPAPDGWASVRLPIENVEQAALLLLGLGPEVEVIEPDEVRERLRALAGQILQLHANAR